MSNLRQKLILLGILALAFGIRAWRLDTDLLLHYDQGRDLLASYSIWHDHRLTLLGPATDIQGIFFGPLYYFLISIPLWLTQGNPVAALLFLQLLEIGSLGLLYLGVKRLFDQSIARYATLLIAVSYGMVSYSRWLSNAMPPIICANILIYLLSRIVTKEYKFIPWAALTIGALWQFNPAVGVGLPIFLLGLMFSTKTVRQYGLLSLVMFLLPAAPQVLFDVRHDFLITRSIWIFLTGSGGAGWSHEVMQASLHLFGRFASYLFTGSQLWQAVVLLLILSISIIGNKLYKQRSVMLLVGLVATQVGTLLLFKRGVFEFFYLSIAPALLILVTVVLVRYIKWGRFAVVCLIIFNLGWCALGFSRPGLNLVPLGSANLVVISDRLAVINALRSTTSTYTLWTYTLPYWQEQVWDYLLVWQKVPAPLEKGDKLFLVYEPDWIDPGNLTAWLSKADLVSTSVYKKTFGTFTLEERQWFTANK